jgi:UDP-4-amino-4,6-dideoxy-N-acetyl-beta-L-altrosamine transaminase
MIPYGRQDISDDDIAAVVDVLRSDFLTQGPAVPRFEAELAKKVGARYAVAVNSATSALHLACLALGVGPGDRVWTSPNTFVASANCARYCGAGVDFVDIDAATYNMSLEALQAKLVKAEISGTLPKVVIPVHFSGQSCDMAEIHALSQRYGFHIIEDASHAIGAAYAGGPVGDCRFSTVAVFSFHPVKIITTGEGGVATTNDAELAYRMATLRTHGITRDPLRLERKDPPAWHYEQHMLGFNYRMIEIEAALGLSQLKRLDEFVAARNRLAARYDTLLAKAPVVRPRVQSNCRSSFHLYVVRLPERASRRHRSVFEAMRNSGIGVNLHYTPVHLQPAYLELGFSRGMFREAENHGDLAITLPLYPALTEGEQNLVVESLQSALDANAS